MSSGIRRIYPWLLAGLAWLADEAMALAAHWQHSPQAHVVGGAAVVLSVWALLRHYRSPGQRSPLESDDDYFRTLEAIARGVAASLTERERSSDDGNRVRSA